MNGFDISTISGLYVGSTEYSAIYKGSTLLWQATLDYSKEYFTIESLEDGNIAYYYCSNSNIVNSIEWSKDKVNWTSITGTPSSNVLITTLDENEKVYIRGTNSYYSSGSALRYNKFVCDKYFKVSGNILSLIYGGDFKNKTNITADNTFMRLFYQSYKLVDASNLILPIMSLRAGCYSSMFRACTSLTAAPVLPATTLHQNCYEYMFYGCTSLTTAPALPANDMAPYCYQYMFRACTSLTTAPELKSISLMSYCYYGMFYGCTRLTTAPELPATTLTTNCYYAMFYGCTSLNYIKMLATDISASNCLNNWVNNVAATGTFVKHADNTTIGTGVSGIPSGWTVQQYDPTVSANASIKIYTNYLTNGSNYISTGTNLTLGSNQNAWHYGNNKYIRFVHGSATSGMGNCDKYNMVITGFTQFKILTVPNQYTSNICHFALSKIGDNTSIKYNNLSSSNEHVQVYMSKSSSEIEYIYTNLDPNTKYNISIYYQNNSNDNTNTGFLIPSSYPNFTLVEASFSSSSDYTEIYG